MAFEVRLSPRAAKVLRSLDARTRSRIVAGMRALEEDPRRSRPGVDVRRIKGTRGRRDAYRLRVGSYRILYDVVGRTVFVTLIFQRGRGYRIS